MRENNSLYYVKGTLFTNLFLFFLTGSQALITPWYSLILLKGGLSPGGVGTAMLVGILVSVLGVKVFLVWVQKTHSGVVRKLCLLISLLVSMIFHVAAVMLLPYPNQIDVMCTREHSDLNEHNHYNWNLSTNTHIAHSENVSKQSSLLKEKTQEYYVPLSTQIPVKENTLPSASATLEATKNSTTSKELKMFSQSILGTPTKSSYVLTVPILTEHLTESSTNTSFNVKGKNTRPWNINSPQSQQNSIFNENNPETDKPPALDNAPFAIIDDSKVKDNSWKWDNPSNSWYNNQESIDGPPPINFPFQISSYLPPGTIKDYSNTYEKNYSEDEPNRHSSKESFYFDFDINKKYPRRLLNLRIKRDKSDLNHTQNDKTKALNDFLKETDKNKYIRKQVDEHTQSKNIFRLPISKRSIYINEQPRYVNNLRKLSGENKEIAIAFLIIIAMFFGKNIEIAMAKLWHSYYNGYNAVQNASADDILEQAVKSSVNFAFHGKHRGWSCIARATCLLTLSLVAIFFCLIHFPFGWSFTALVLLHSALGIFAIFSLLMIPIFNGNIEMPKVNRPLSLYLDDEVLWEGLRRLGFHIWVMSQGILASLPLFYNIWVIEELFQRHQDVMYGKVVNAIFQAQCISVALNFLGEGLIVVFQRRWALKIGVTGLMGFSVSCILTQYALTWISYNPWIVACSTIFLGIGVAFMWMAVKDNAFLLATNCDQEREAWTSWLVWKLGQSIGAFLWGLAMETSWARNSVFPLLVPCMAVAGMSMVVIATTAFLTRRNVYSRRRIYHTLDLFAGANGDDDDSDEEQIEDDWLVRTAKQKGVVL